MNRLFLFGAAAALLASCAPASAGVRTIVLDIEHSRFEPARVTVERGETVRFVVRNLDPIDHELIVGDIEVQDAHENGTETHHGAKPGEVSVAAQETAETTYTFASGGDLWFGCHLPSHWDYGMRGTIAVQG